MQRRNSFWMFFLTVVTSIAILILTNGTSNPNGGVKMLSEQEQTRALFRSRDATCGPRKQLNAQTGLCECEPGYVGADCAQDVRCGTVLDCGTGAGCADGQCLCPVGNFRVRRDTPTETCSPCDEDGGQILRDGSCITPDCVGKNCGPGGFCTNGICTCVDSNYLVASGTPEERCSACDEDNGMVLQEVNGRIACVDIRCSQVQCGQGGQCRSGQCVCTTNNFLVNRTCGACDSSLNLVLDTRALGTVDTGPSFGGTCVHEDCLSLHCGTDAFCQNGLCNCRAPDQRLAIGTPFEFCGSCDAEAGFVQTLDGCVQERCTTLNCGSGGTCITGNCQCLDGFYVEFLNTPVETCTACTENSRIAACRGEVCTVPLRCQPGTCRDNECKCPSGYRRILAGTSNERCSRCPRGQAEDPRPESPTFKECISERCLRIDCGSSGSCNIDGHCDCSWTTFHVYKDTDQETCAVCPEGQSVSSLTNRCTPNSDL